MHGSEWEGRSVTTFSTPNFPYITLNTHFFKNLSVYYNQME
jgi:hypothetical protein